MERLGQWVLKHDDSWVFVALYVGLAVVLSLWISLFWLVAVVAVHAALEAFVLTRRGVRTGMAGHILWHLKLDLALIAFALALGVYLDTLFGLVGLGAVAKAGARMLSWQQAIRGILLTVDDAAQIARAVTAGMRRQAEPDNAEDGPGWSRGDLLSVGLGTASVLAILAAPALTNLTASDVAAILAADLHPWPGE